MSNFNPGTRSSIISPYGDNAARMEGTKANFSAALLTSEACMGKCSVNTSTDSMSAPESECLRMCFVKYFDC